MEVQILQQFLLGVHSLVYGRTLNGLPYSCNNKVLIINNSSIRSSGEDIGKVISTRLNRRLLESKNRGLSAASSDFQA